MLFSVTLSSVHSCLCGKCLCLGLLFFSCFSLLSLVFWSHLTSRFTEEEFCVSVLQLRLRLLNPLSWIFSLPTLLLHFEAPQGILPSPLVFSPELFGPTHVSVSAGQMYCGSAVGEHRAGASACQPSHVLCCHLTSDLTLSTFVLCFFL